MNYKSRFVSIAGTCSTSVKTAAPDVIETDKKTVPIAVDKQTTGAPHTTQCPDGMSCNKIVDELMQFHFVYIRVVCYSFGEY